MNNKIIFFGVGIATGLLILGAIYAVLEYQGETTVKANIERFDTLDFEAFSHQDWELFNAIHSEDVVVIFPDGRRTVGIEQHDKDIAAMFEFAPDMRVTSHPIKVGSGDWTAVAGVIEGTFTQPMVLPDGTEIPPTGKSFKIPMATIAHWKDGKITEENLFWDTSAMMAQMGIA